MTRRLAVVGTLLVDTIHRSDGAIVESLGGIAYSVAYLAAQAPAGVRIEPICRVGSDQCEGLRSAWEHLPCVDSSFLLQEAMATPRNTLTYDGAGGVGDRSEHPTGLLAPLAEEDLLAAEGADLALVNFITGKDCTLAALRWLSGSCQRVYLDVHSLALGFAEDGTRIYRRPPGWESWIACADVVQCNRAEAATLAGLDAFDHDPAEVDAFLERQLTRAASRRRGRPSAVVLTEGKKGATLVWRRRGRVDRVEISAPSVDVVDPTGAGDAFGSGYALAWLLGADPAEAAAVGTRTGTAACTISGVGELARLREAIETLRG